MRSQLRTRKATAMTAMGDSPGWAQLRVAYLTPEYGDVGVEKGGLGYYLARTVPLVAAEGARCEVYLCSGSRSDSASVTTCVDGVAVHRVSGSATTPFDDLTLPAQVHRHLRSAWLLAETLASGDASDVDVVQVPNFGLSGLFVDVRAPVVMRFSSHAATWHAAAGAKRDARAVLTEMLQRRAIDRVSGHYAPSRFVASLVSAETGVPVEVIPPPMPPIAETAEWDAQWHSKVTNGTPYVVHAGQLGAAKGTDIVVDAAERLLSRGAGVRFHFCGPDAGAGSKIERLQRMYPEGVAYHGRLPRTRLLPLMNHALAVLCPSRADNLPNVAIEALALGTPVVGTRGASIDELVDDGESGFLIALDGASLASAISTMLALPVPDLKRMRQAAHLKISETLDAGRQTRALIEFYRSVAGRPTTARRPRLAAAKMLRADLIAMQPWFQDAGGRSGKRNDIFGRWAARWRGR